MIRCLAIASACVILVDVSGCSSSPEDIVKKQISLMNDLADAIEKKDEAKAKSLAQELKENSDKLKDIKEEDKKQLEEKYKEDMMKAAFKLLAAAMKDPQFTNKLDLPKSK